MLINNRLYMVICLSAVKFLFENTNRMQPSDKNNVVGDYLVQPKQTLCPKCRKENLDLEGNRLILLA